MVRRLGVLAAIALTTACGDSYSESKQVPVDAGTEGAPPAGACDPSVLYVSSSGDDANDGCDSAKPRKTVTSAIGYAIAKNGGRAEIRLCAETLRERVVVGSATSLVGGFDCKSWAPGAGRTTIEAPSADVVETVITFGAAVGTDTRLEHLRIVGPKRASGEVASLRVIGGASPTIRDSEIEGGTTESGHSITLAIEMSSPTIEDTKVFGGRGTCASGCSATYATGMSVSGGRPRLARARIEGGTANVTTKDDTIGSITLDVQGDVKATGADAFTDVEIVGGVGNVGGVYPVMGVRAGLGVDVELVRSVVRPSDTVSTCSTSPCFTVGALAGAGILRLRRSAVSSLPAKAGGGTTSEVVIREGAATALGGRLEGRSSAFYSRTGAIDVLANGTVDIAGSTIVGAELVSNAGGTVDIRSSLLAQTVTNAPAFGLVACPTVARTTLDRSVILGSPPTFARFFSDEGQSACTGGPVTTTLAAAVAASGGKTTFAASNVKRRAFSCAGEDSSACTEVPACNPDSASYADSCLVTVFTSSAAPLKLKDGVSCAIATGGSPLADVPEDIEGKPRTTPPSVGAYEHDGACSP